MKKKLSIILIFTMVSLMLLSTNIFANDRVENEDIVFEESGISLFYTISINHSEYRKYNSKEDVPNYISVTKYINETDFNSGNKIVVKVSGSCAYKSIVKNSDGTVTAYFEGVLIGYV